ncbi:MAG: hypothetical protein ACHQHO_06805 [Solirubrobacterales bacterium]
MTMVDNKLVPPAWMSIRMLVVGMAVAVLVSLTASSQALAEEHHPTGDFAVFADCPLGNPLTKTCIYSQTQSGEVTIGKKTVPISRTITLQGGIHRNLETEIQEFIAAEDGNTLSTTPEPVPGGLAGLVNCNEISEPVARLACELVFQNGLTGVNATTELAKPASSIGINTSHLLEEEGVALSLPVKIHLENPLLGSECYIGSSASPVTLNLTDGSTSPPPPNKPIKGKVGTLEFKDETNFLEVTENTLVDNAFSAPAASGCGGLLASVIDPVVDAQLGLPAAAGTNTAIQNNTIRDANAGAVRSSE